MKAIAASKKKTDKLDAQILAVFGERVQPRLYEGKDAKERELSALLVRRRQLPKPPLPTDTFHLIWLKHRGWDVRG